MNFVQVEFPVFLLCVLAAYWGLRDRVWQNRLLVVASAVVYGWVHPWFLALLYGSAVLDFSMARAIARFPGNKRWFLAASMCGNLGLLAYFKYFDFFAANFAAAFAAMGLDAHPATLGVMLPVGISFYTFQTMGYTVDVYRGELKPRTNFVDYLLYVSFFAQLVAGPIERAGRLLPQIERALRSAAPLLAEVELVGAEVADEGGEGGEVRVAHRDLGGVALLHADAEHGPKEHGPNAEQVLADVLVALLVIADDEGDHALGDRCSG